MSYKNNNCKAHIIIAAAAYPIHKVLNQTQYEL
jgi:hypothetical protein